MEDHSSQRAASLLDSFQRMRENSGNSLKDGYPWESTASFGKNTSKTYYYLDSPSDQDLYRIARLTELGWRITWKTAFDTWLNEFKLNFTELDDEGDRQRNKLLRKQLNKVKFFSEGFRATGFDRELGESLLFIHRKGDQWELEGNTYKLLTPADITEPVIRVEAVSHLDYTIPMIEPFGTANQYNINFYRGKGQKYMYQVDTSRAVRWKCRNIEYDQYQGQSALKAVFGTMQILLLITRGIGDLANRYGTGIPTIYAKNCRSAKDVQNIKTIIGNPTTQSWMLIPTELVEKIEMLSAATSAIDFKQLADVCINLISAQTGIPRPILMGEVAGVVTGSEINEREYFAFLNACHREVEPFVREYLALDPVCAAIIGDREYDIDWGLRQVMSKLDEAALNERIYNNAYQALNFSTFDEVREIAGKPPIASVIKDVSAFTKRYGASPEQVGEWLGLDVLSVAGSIAVANQGGDETENSPSGNNTSQEKPKTPDQEEETDKKETASQIKESLNHLFDAREELSLNKLSFASGVPKQHIARLLSWAQNR